jgi:Phytanoyl-CoA dioxygenase (PhyH)
MLTATQREEFETHGTLRLTGAFGVRVAQQMTTRIWEVLERSHGVRRDDARSWDIPQPTGFQTLTRSGAFDAIASAALCEDIDQLLDSWERPKHWGAPLVTFPGAPATWDLPSTQWHLDFPARGSLQPLPGIRVLAFIDRVEPRSGGTLVLSGSHRLVESLMSAGLARSGHSSEVREALAERHEWLSRLWRTSAIEDRIARFMRDGAEIEGQPLRVVELTGGPGDVVLLHPRLFHAPSRNVGAKPRLMLSQLLSRHR